MALVLVYFVVLALQVLTQQVQERELLAAVLAVKLEQEPLSPSVPVVAVVVALECHP